MQGETNVILESVKKYISVEISTVFTKFVVPCVMSGFCPDVVEIITLLGHYTV
jgi:hypothetical protein